MLRPIKHPWIYILIVLIGCNSGYDEYIIPENSEKESSRVDSEDKIDQMVVLKSQDTIKLTFTKPMKEEIVSLELNHSRTNTFYSLYPDNFINSKVGYLIDSNNRFSLMDTFFVKVFYRQEVEDRLPRYGSKLLEHGSVFTSNHLKEQIELYDNFPLFTMDSLNLELDSSFIYEIGLMNEMDLSCLKDLSISFNRFYESSSVIIPYGRFEYEKLSFLLFCQQSDYGVDLVIAKYIPAQHEIKYMDAVAWLYGDAEDVQIGKSDIFYHPDYLQVCKNIITVNSELEIDGDEVKSKNRVKRDSNVTVYYQVKPRK